MKKMLALVMAGAMVVAMGGVVLASGKTGKEIYDAGYSKEELYDSNVISDQEYCAFLEYLTSVGMTEEDYFAELANRPAGGTSSSGESSSSSDSSASGGEEVIYDRGSEAAALAAEASGIPMATSIAASEENKSVGEYMNNAVVAAPGLDNAVPVSQGGNVIINGEPSNQTFSVLKVLSGHTDAAKAQAAAIGGKVLNVARIDASVYFDTATVNFYMPGVTTGQNIQVYQYDYTNGQWVSVAVAEVREDHVVVDMTSLGVLAFIEVPAAE